MDASGRSPLPALLIAGVAYAAIGVGTADWQPLGADRVRLWRLLAWAASAIVFAIHIGWERLARRSAPRAAASRTALAVALGAFGIALGASIHNRRPMPSAMILWPILTALPAFVVAWIAGAVIGRRAPTVQERP